MMRPHRDVRSARLPSLAIAALLVSGGPVAAQPSSCSEGTGPLIELGWSDYRAGDLGGASGRFSAALDCDPATRGAKTGLGYVALRRDSLGAARSAFTAVLEGHPDDVDALTGLGLVAWREGDSEEARGALERVLRQVPNHAEAAALLERLAPGDRQLARGPAPPKPDTTVYPARVNGDRFEVRSPAGWEPFYIKGVNLGAALPGRHPSQFPDSAVYAGWIADMAEMGVNLVRVYTIQPPGFYEALLDHNRRNADRPLWLMHGVWAELPPDDDYGDPRWEASFFEEVRHVVDVVHGWAALAPRPGHAAGRYSSDVSAWTLAYLIGREWEPFSVLKYNRLHPGVRDWSGRYLHMAGGTAMDAWLARACDTLIDYEMEAYGAQRPIGYTNWPTLDPLHHPTETTVEEELNWREALGEEVKRRPMEYDNDAIGLDACLVEPTPQLPAGYYAAFHAYPYYPDFMSREPAYRDRGSEDGASHYLAYLRELKARLSDVPIVIAEYGVPASLGTAHLHPEGWHHGGHDEMGMARINGILTREIAAAGMAGGVLFAWIDEWFKKNWLVIDMEIPLDRNRLWLNRMDAEQHYGIIALEPVERLAGEAMVDRIGAWREVPALYDAGGGQVLRAVADEAYLWLTFEPDLAGGDELLIGFDMAVPAAGDFEWPAEGAPSSPVGLEFVLHVTGDEARLLVDPPSNPFRIEPVRQGFDESRLLAPVVGGAPPGTFTARAEKCYRRPLRTVANRDGRYDSLRVVTNRPRFSRDGTEYLALGYDRGVLPPGPPPDGLWERDALTGTIEVRIPWALLNVTDPSRRRILQDGGPAADPCEGDPHEQFGTVTIDDIGIVAISRSAGSVWRPLPESGTAHDVARYSWPTWEQPRWRARRRPVFDEMREVFAGLAPTVTEQEQ